MKINDIKGISGCNLEISNLSVKKISSGIDYNERLGSQLKKQLLFYEFSIQNVKVPKIIDKGKQDGLFFFEMEYIKGLNPIEYFLLGDINQIDNFKKNIEYFLLFIEKNIIKGDMSLFKQRVLDKLNTLKNKSEYDEFINFLIKKVNYLKSDSYPKSLCHGDLTLSNIICSSNDIYLIDFLDSFIDTIYVDLAKIKQDLYYRWTLTNFFNLNTQQNIRINQITNKIWSDIESKFEIYLKTDEFKIIEALNFLRIIPYQKEESMKQYVSKTIKSLLIYEEFNYTNGR